MTKTNKYGLSSYIPFPTRRTIRQNCGFGCIICGNAITDYEHVDPTFEEAREHDSDKMTLLCPNHHARVTRGLLSKAVIKESMINPFCKRKGEYYLNPFDIGTEIPKIVIGKAIFLNTKEILNINNTSILAFLPPEEGSQFFRISGLFFDKEGNKIVEIKENEFSGSIDNWDVEIVGSTITIRLKKRVIALKIRTIPRGEICIKKIDMSYEGYRVYGDINTYFEISTPLGGSSRFIDCTFSNLKTAIKIEDSKIRFGMN